MDEIIDNYSEILIVACIVILAITAGEYFEIKKVLSKLLVICTFLIVLFNTKIVIAKQNHKILDTPIKRIEFDPDSQDPLLINDATVTPEINSHEKTDNQFNSNQNYIVKKNDSLYSIATKFSSEKEMIDKLWLEIISLNTQNLISKNPNLIFPGELILIPLIKN